MVQKNAHPSGEPARKSRIVVIATLVVLVVPVLLDLALHSATTQYRLFAYAAPDTFYYLTVARHIGLHGSFSFDGEHVSNGYHPLWQVLTAIPYALRLPGANSPWVLAYLVAFALVLQSTALGFLARAFRRPDGSLSWLFVAMPAGVYALCICPLWVRLTTKELMAQNGMEGAEPVYGTWWSYVNGMETSLVLACFALVAWLAARPRPLDRPMMFGLAMAGLTFARLDHALIALPILIGICLSHVRESGSLRERLQSPLKTLLAFALPIIIYLVVNKVFVGSWLPISGRLKTSFPRLTGENFNYLVRFINRSFSEERHILDEAWRTLQLAVPSLFALLTPLVVLRFRLRRGHLIVGWAGPNPHVARLLLLVALGVLTLAFYNFFFVYFYGVGHWYFPVSTLFTSLVCLFGVERIRAAWMERRARMQDSSQLRSVGGRILGYALPVAIVLTTLVSFLPLHRTPNYHARFATFAIEEAPKLRARFARTNIKLIDSDDGIVAWASEFTSMSGVGLGLDVEAAQAKVNKPGLLPLALERGYTHAAALVYVDPRGLRTDAPKDVEEWVAKWGAFTQLGDVHKYEWKVAYRSEKRDFMIVRFAPRESPRPQESPP